MSLYQIVFSALVAWSPHAPVPVLQVTAEAITAATETMGKGEQFALELARLAREESNFLDYVLDGRCNDRGWKDSPEGKKRMGPGTCDGGRAVGIWQVHPAYKGPTAKELLDIKGSVYYVAQLWDKSPALWTPWKLVKYRVRQYIGAEQGRE